DAGPDGQAYALLLQPDGKLVAAGVAIVDNNTYTGVARYNTDGTLDSTFGVGGVVTNLAFIGYPYAMILQPNGKLVTAGFTVDSTGNLFDAILMRFNPNGTPDKSFGINGVVTTGVKDTDYVFAKAIAAQPDGKLVMAGYAQTGATDELILAR